MSGMEILVTQWDVPQIAIDLLKQHNYTVIINEERPYPSKEQIIAKVRGVNAILWCSKFRLDKDIIDAAGPNLKVIGTKSAGYNHIDVELLKARGIKLGNTPDVVNSAVAETAVMLALAASKRLTEGRRVIENGTWTFGDQWLLGREIRDSTIGIVGFGGIGQAISKNLQPFNISRIIYSGHKEKPDGKKFNAIFVTFDELLKESDYVFACVPLTNETTNMFNKSAFEKMKNSAIFVNISRGEVVNQVDLIEALKKNVIFGAGLDVMTPEPLPTDHDLLKLDNCVLLPHLGTATVRTRSDMATLTAENIIRGLKGERMLTPVV